MRCYIHDYAILASKTVGDGYFWLEGYKTLRTMRTYFYKLRTKFRGLKSPHTFLLVARDSDRNIIKVYDIIERGSVVG